MERLTMALIYWTLVSPPHTHAHACTFAAVTMSWSQPDTTGSLPPPHIHTHAVTMSWSQPDTTGSSPPARCDHTSVTVGNKLYVTCGSGSDTLWYSDLYTLDLGSYEWACVDVKGIPPVPRDCASLCAVVGQVSVCVCVCVSVQ